jgi:hypothetical protein
LLGYHVSYTGLADWGYEIREGMIDSGIDPDDALNRIQGDLRTVRNRFNTLYDLKNAFNRWNGGSFPGDFIHIFSGRCDELAENAETAALFVKPDERLSLTELGFRSARTPRRNAGSPVVS